MKDNSLAILIENMYIFGVISFIELDYSIKGQYQGSQIGVLFANWATFSQLLLLKFLRIRPATFWATDLRKQKYRDIFDLINTGNDENTFKNFVLISRFNAIERIYSQYLELKTHFSMVYEKEKCNLTRVLSEAYKDQRNKVILLLLCPTLKQINNLNLYFQKDKIDMHKAHLELQYYILTIANKVFKKDFLSSLKTHSEREFRILIDNPFARLSLNEIDFGAEFELEIKEAKLHSNEILKIKESCKDFLLVLLTELIDKLPSHFTVLAKVQFISPDIILCHRRPRFSELPFQLFSLELQSDAEFEYDLLITFDWKSQFENGVISSDPEEFWKKAYSIKRADGKKMFEKLSKFAFCILSLPHSYALVERAFSYMNLIKSKIRNRLKIETLNSLMRVKFDYIANQTCCNSFSPTKEMLKLFTSAMYSNEENQGYENEESIEDIIEMGAYINVL